MIKFKTMALPKHVKDHGENRFNQINEAAIEKRNGESSSKQSKVVQAQKTEKADHTRKQ